MHNSHLELIAEKRLLLFSGSGYPELAHQLAAAGGGPVCLEDSVIVAQVADPHPEMPAGDERIDRG